ncbi:hypothetical protein AMAG_12121 [Allomyces macrogynus ATCC 38327]|uniref:Uncharacterized protein n=1 Tax=Allomyces macrogynus (strain ATCC 38327) TaxID=578462 RepID=A0A0L0SXJ5_ALLM3|nr:hypothetical protein AMAG_12121 [Allomyces macrogynus ATCC 38327]|eukprot:KNE67044.1 hypothetical protein AMAG_12121 [Allomyces macrogynus ATCC 38327]
MTDPHAAPAPGVPATPVACVALDLPEHHDDGEYRDGQYHDEAILLSDHDVVDVRDGGADLARALSLSNAASSNPAPANVASTPMPAVPAPSAPSPSSPAGSASPTTSDTQRAPPAPTTSAAPPPLSSAPAPRPATAPATGTSLSAPISKQELYDTFDSFWVGLHSALHRGLRLPTPTPRPDPYLAVVGSSPAPMPRAATAAFASLLSRIFTTTLWPALDRYNLNHVLAGTVLHAARADLAAISAGVAVPGPAPSRAVALRAYLAPALAAATTEIVALFAEYAVRDVAPEVVVFRAAAIHLVARAAFPDAVPGQVARIVPPRGSWFDKGLHEAGWSLDEGEGGRVVFCVFPGLVWFEMVNGETEKVDVDRGVVVYRAKVWCERVESGREGKE